MRTLLIANRGEIALRIMRSAQDLGIRTVAVYSDDDAGALHTRRADEARRLRGAGAAAYLDGKQILAAADASGADAIHPGYGFLSENAAFAQAVVEAGIIFVGPRPDTLALLGDKTQARALAERCSVPVLKGTPGAVNVAEADRFFASLEGDGAVMLKALAGGGGRGMRVVRHRADIAAAHARCRSEALQAFGNGDVYVEQLMARPRHIEVQILGDGSHVSHLGERECSIQRRHQKLVEIAPCPSLSPQLRERLTRDAVRLADALQYLNAGTFEFLVGADDAYAFIEANPRLQVEHTVTEAVLGIDLVAAQLQLAAGRTLADLGLRQQQVPKPRGFAVQVRVNAETMNADGAPRPGSGTVTEFEPPAGPGVRIDTAGSVGYHINSNFDSLLAKVIAHSTSARFADAVARTARALREFTIEGVPTNIPFLQRVLAHPEFVANRIHTSFIDDNLADLTEQGSSPVRSAHGGGQEGAAPKSTTGSRARAVDPNDPLAILAYGKTGQAPPLPPQSGGKPPHSKGFAELAHSKGRADSLVVVHAPMQGTIVSLIVADGDAVRAGQALLVMNAMKMEHVVEAPAGGVIRELAVAEGDTVAEGQPLLYIEPGEQALADAQEMTESDLDHVRADLDEALGRRALTRDAARPDAVARRRATGQRTARENIADLCDPDSFVEYGGLAIAAQRQRRSVQDLIERTPADGLIAGIGRVNGDLFDESRSRCAVLSYDYTVLAGTQGFQNHRKKDRLFELAERLRLPVVFFTEGGGGRPGDTDAPGVAGLDCMAFHLFGRLSGLVPLVGINSGRCFAGNAALLGSCDVVIATANSNIGMGGPAMIEGGGLGVFRPEDVGPMDVQVPNGVVDIAVADEAEAVRVAKQYLAYFQGPLAQWNCADQRRLRGIIPENRLRVYDVRRVIATLADRDSVLELRRSFGPGMVTALIRIEGQPIGVIANNPKHLAGAIDSAGADKAARFMQLCDAFDIPLLCLCDTPGIMVGPEVETTALVRHCCRMFVIGASLSVPVFTIVLRKGYGLGAQAMAGGSFKAPLFTVAWPTGEFGGMGLEGAVKLGFRKELAAISEAEERRKLFEHMVGRAYEHGKALNSASHFEIDDVIDPAESRQWVMNLLRAVPPPPPGTGKKRPCVDTW